MKMLRGHRPRPATAIAIAALVTALGGAAFAAIPDSGGTVHACYQKSTGNLRVVESASDCRTTENPLALSAAGQSVGGGQIVTRARSTGPVDVDADTVPIPLTGNTWTQGPADTNQLFIEATISVPPPGQCPLSQADFTVGGETIGSAVWGGGGNDGQVVRRISTFLLDPGSPTTRTITATARTSGTGSGCGARIDSVRINVAATS